MQKKRKLVILGATGTVGAKALSILEEANLDIEVVAASAHTRMEDLRSLIPGNGRSFLTSNEHQCADLLGFLKEGEYDICLNAVVGAAGLPFSAAVLQGGKILGLANKESLVMAGNPLARIADETGAVIVPVDSEHSAIHQCLRGEKGSTVRGIFLTASGGALRDLPLESLDSVTPEQALEHPNWAMGPRITVDSATMMNKALEIVEACHLFDLPPDKVHVVLHRQSVTHSMVEFEDGSVMAQMGPPDMAFPIHYALHWPDRAPFPRKGFDPTTFSRMDFEIPASNRWPALELGWEAARQGGASGAVINAADEVAVAAFLEGDLPFPGIVSLCRETLEAMPQLPLESIQDALDADTWARNRAREMISLPAQS